MEFRVGNGGGDGTSCFNIKIGLLTNTTKLTNVRITGVKTVQIFVHYVRWIFVPLMVLQYL